MKKLHVLIPSLVATVGMPLVGLVGCGDPQPEPEPEVESIKIKGIEQTYTFGYLSGHHTLHFSIIATIGGKEKDVSADSTFEASGDIVSYVPSPSDQPTIFLQDEPSLGYHGIHITAHYRDKDAEFNTTVSIVADGTISFDGIKSQYVVTPGESGHTDSIIVNYTPKGTTEKVEVTNLCHFFVTSPPAGIDWDDAEKQLVWTEDFASSVPASVTINIDALGDYYHTTIGFYSI